MTTIQDLIKIVQKYNNKKTDIEHIREAYEFALVAHKNQARKSGHPYIVHPLETAVTLAEMNLDTATITAALLHDVPEDTIYNLIDVEKKFGGEVARLVMGITKLNKIKYRGIERYAENLRKMFISMAEDVRVVLIKMADRLNNLKTLNVHPPNKRKRIALEVLEIYSPIANRLGMGQLKGELEDLAFPFAYPKEYEWFQKTIMPVYEEKIAETQSIQKEVEKEFNENHVRIISIHGRKKHIYSLYKKLLRPQYDRDITKIYDLVAIRIIVSSVSDCYKILGIIHKKWKLLPGRIKDYISQPKPNNYQSLHTTIFTQSGKVVEFQIRTPQMHEQAELGIAAYWHFKEGGMKFFSKIPGFHFKGYNPPKKLKWIHDLAEWQKYITDSGQFLDSLKIDALSDRIFLFTPQGDVIELPEDSTPIDFAYHIHTEVGEKCAAVKINGQIASLDTPLKNGDMVEIIIEKKRKGPSQDWLRFVKTSTAKSKIKSFLIKLHGYAPVSRFLPKQKKEGYARASSSPKPKHRKKR